MRRPVACSTVWTSSFGPPSANAALILLVPWPGIFTCESRGRLSSVGFVELSGRCAIMIVSVRCPPASPESPVASRSSSAADRPWRLSEPTISQFVPDAAAGRPE